MLDDLKHSGHRPLSVETLALLSSAVMEDGGGVGWGGVTITLTREHSNTVTFGQRQHVARSLERSKKSSFMTHLEVLVD